jgi:hypothetical protein
MGEIMKYGISVLLLSATLSAQAGPADVNASMTYNITLQNQVGIDQQTVAATIGSETRELKMVGGVVQISPPTATGGQSVIRFYAANGADRVLMHTANITSASGKPLRIAYTLCGQSLRFQSPAPEKLETCPAVAGVSER